MVHAFHQEFTHGRVFRGLDALHHMEQHKRDSHGNRIKMNIPEGMKMAAVAGKDSVSEDVATVYSVVYVTASQSSDGDVVSYSTASTTASTSLSTGPHQTTREPSTSATLNADQSAYAAAKSSAHAQAASSSTTASTTATAVPVESSSSAAATSASPMTTFATSSAASTSSFAGNAVTVGGEGGAVQATRVASSDQQIQQNSTGMTGGQQAGLALGILAAFALAAGFLWFCWRKRKTTRKEGHEQLIDEKHGSFFGSNQATPNGMPAKRFSNSSVQSDKVPASVRSTRTASVAPRLSLRPVTQFLPNLVGGETKSNGNTLAVAGAQMSEKHSAWERRAAPAAENPFADAAVLSEKDARPGSSGSQPRNPFEEPESVAGNRPVTAGSNHSKDSSWQGSEPPTPKSVKVGTAAAVAIRNSGPAAPPVPTQPNNVHRVQLDFKPSMEDELELRSGQLVRMLHEYDDGWALCIRMDRSQQGVAPRTCLSKLPVKPRNSPPPNGQRQPLPGQQRRPSNPNGPMFPRPLTPTGPPQANRQRSATGDRGAAPAGFEGRSRSQSDAQKSAGAGMPTRKPVPGQAM